MHYRAPRKLRKEDQLDAFDCRSSEQTQWLRNHARQADAMGTATTFVVTTTDNEVAAFYAWSMASITAEHSPVRLLKGAGRYPQPVALLARLGVSIDHERQGIGAALLKDAISRVAVLGAEIGCRGLLIHAETPDARDFYLHLLPDFQVSPTDDLHLVLMMKDIRKSLAE